MEQNTLFQGLIISSLCSIICGMIRFFAPIVLDIVTGTIANILSTIIIDYVKNNYKQHCKIRKAHPVVAKQEGHFFVETSCLKEQVGTICHKIMRLLYIPADERKIGASPWPWLKLFS